MKILNFVLISLLLTGCVKKEKQTPSENNNHTPVTIPDAHTSQNALDWAGTYQGTLPCASCSAIKMEILLNRDGSYEQTNVYEHDGESDVVISSGTFNWDESGSIITLNSAEKPNQFFVGENYLATLDMDGNRITGDLADKYILTKE